MSEFLKFLIYKKSYNLKFCNFFKINFNQRLWTALVVNEIIHCVLLRFQRCWGPLYAADRSSSAMDDLCSNTE